MSTPTFLMVDPAHFEVAYAINPWMEPHAWRADRDALRLGARAGSASLASALRAAGARVEIVPGVAGAPDLVFPANAATVLDGRAILARFLCPERRIEEPIFRRVFESFRDRGLVKDVVELPPDAVQEGAGDLIWDSSRGLFWGGFGQRSNRAGMQCVADVFGRETVALELATPRFYHLDTCFCPLPGGEILYYPPAFTPAARRAIEARVTSSQLIVASDEDAARFCVNAVALGHDIIMATAADRLRGVLDERGYRLHEVGLAPFILSGGSAYCMTLRLDRSSADDEARRLDFKEAAQ